MASSVYRVDSDEFGPDDLSRDLSDDVVQLRRRLKLTSSKRSGESFTKIVSARDKKEADMLGAVLEQLLPRR